MMVFYTENWNKQDMLSKVLETIEYCKKRLDFKGHVKGWHGLYYQDQNVLNYVCDKKLHWFSKSYNYLYVLDRHAFYKKQFHNESYKEQSILHFAGYTKPWHEWAMPYEIIHEYNEIKEEYSPWKDIAMVEATGKKQYHQAARTALYFGNKRQALFWYKRYWLKKLHIL